MPEKQVLFCAALTVLLLHSPILYDSLLLQPFSLMYYLQQNGKRSSTCSWVVITEPGPHNGGGHFEVTTSMLFRSFHRGEN